MTRTSFGCIAFSDALLSLFLVLASTSVTAQEQCGTSVIAPNRGYTAWLGTNVVGVYAASSTEGGLKAKLAPIVDRILSGACDSYSYTWDSPFNGGYQFSCTIDGGPADGADSVSSVDVPAIGDPGGVYCPGGYAANWYFDEELGHEVVGCGLKNRSLQSCSTAPSPDRERGEPSCGRGNPCDVGSGNKYQAETDYAGVGGSALVFKRHYNSDLETPTAELGMYWRDHYDRKLLFSTDPSFEAYHDGPESIFAQRPDGRVIQFLVSGSTFIPKYADTRERLALAGSNTWTLTTADHEVETYKLVGGGAGSFGRLESIRLVQGDTLTLTYATDNLIKLNKVSDTFGHALTFTYNSGTGRLATMKDPANDTYTYQYNGAGYLSTVIYPDTTPANQNDNPRRKYNYADATNPGALTSLVDENNSTFATWTYDAERRAISSQHAGGAQRIDIAYGTGNTAAVTHVGGQTESFEFDLIGRSNKPTSIDGGTVDRSIEYDSNGYPERIVDARGVERLMSHDSRGLETSRTEASGTASERTVSTQWHATFSIAATRIRTEQIDCIHIRRQR